MRPLKHPRTLEEAFGPHTSRRVYENVPPATRREKLVYAVSIVALITIIGVVAL